MSTANRSEYEDWNGEDGRRWVADADRRDRLLAAVAQELLSDADVQPGESVVDVGCGCGATTLAVARAAGPKGAVLGVDISDVMLGVARERVAHADVSGVTLLQADAQTHRFEPARYDVAVSRFGTMFFDDPVAAFTNIARSLRPGGRLCLATWQPLVANDWLTIPGAALLRYGSLPEAAEGPGMFAQSEPAVIGEVLRSSGFAEVEVRALRVPLHLGDSPADAADHLANTGLGHAVLATIPERLQAKAVEDVREVLAEHQTSAGVELPGGILLTRARLAPH